MTEYKKAFDNDGNEIEVLYKSEAEKLIQEKEEKLLETEEKLKKLETKDFNWNAFKNATKEEKEKMVSMLTEAEKKIIEQQETHAKELEELKTERISDFKNDALNVLIGDDEDLRKKILANYDRIVGEAKTKQEIQAKIKEAYNMVGAPSFNPILNVANTTTMGELNRKPKETLTPEQKEFAKKFGVSDETVNKYGKKTG